MDNPQEIVRVIQSIKAIKALSASKYEAQLRPPSRVRHDNTKTTKAVDAIAEECKNKTQRMLNLIKHDLRVMEERGEVIQINAVKERYAAEIHDIYAGCSRKLLLATVEYVEGFTERTHELTEADIRFINEQTAKDEAAFWKIADTMMANFTVTGTFDPVELREEQFGHGIETNFDERLDIISTSLTYSGLGTLAVLLLREEKQRMDREALRNMGSELEVTPRPFHVIWVTARDDRVCNRCAPLDGRTFDIDDVHTPRPVDDTHPRCRCRLMAVDQNTRAVFNA